MMALIKDALSRLFIAPFISLYSINLHGRAMKLSIGPQLGASSIILSVIKSCELWKYIDNEGPFPPYDAKPPNRNSGALTICSSVQNLETRGAMIFFSILLPAFTNLIVLHPRVAPSVLLLLLFIMIIALTMYNNRLLAKRRAKRSINKNQSQILAWPSGAAASPIELSSTLQADSISIDRSAAPSSIAALPPQMTWLKSK